MHGRIPTSSVIFFCFLGGVLPCTISIEEGSLFYSSSPDFFYLFHRALLYEMDLVFFPPCQHLLYILFFPMFLPVCLLRLCQSNVRNLSEEEIEMLFQRIERLPPSQQEHYVAELEKMLNIDSSEARTPTPRVGSSSSLVHVTSMNRKVMQDSISSEKSVAISDSALDDFMASISHLPAAEQIARLDEVGDGYVSASDSKKKHLIYVMILLFF